MNALTRYQLRQEVRYILRDESLPEEDINAALNRVIADISNAGRFRFQQSAIPIMLIAGTYRYTFDPTLLGDYTVVWASFVKDKQKVLNKGSELIDAITEGRFTVASDAPDFYWVWGGEIYFDGIPNATAAAQPMTVFGWRDLSDLVSDLQTPAPLPARYHRNVLARGAAAQLKPDAIITTGTGQIPVAAAFSNGMTDFVRQELWKPQDIQTFDVDDRFAHMDEWGNISAVR